MRLTKLLLFLPIVGGAIGDSGPRAEPSKSITLEDLEQNLNDLHEKQVAIRKENFDMFFRPGHEYNQVQTTMASEFRVLPHATERDLPLHLLNINSLRTDGYRFNRDVDPGLSLPFGQKWDFRLHGPYPSARLTQEALEHHSDEEGMRKLRMELGNARRARLKQWFQDNRKGGMQGLMSWTDDLDLLTAAIGYHNTKLAQDLRGKGLQISKSLKITLRRRQV